MERLFGHAPCDTFSASLQVNFFVDLIYEYLPSIVITLANFITPLLFSVIINLEDYSPAFEIRFTLMRYCGLTSYRWCYYENESSTIRKLGTRHEYSMLTQ